MAHETVQKALGPGSSRLPFFLLVRLCLCQDHLRLGLDQKWFFSIPDTSARRKSSIMSSMTISDDGGVSIFAAEARFTRSAR